MKHTLTLIAFMLTCTPRLVYSDAINVQCTVFSDGPHGALLAPTTIEVERRLTFCGMSAAGVRLFAPEGQACNGYATLWETLVPGPGGPVHFQLRTGIMLGRARDDRRRTRLCSAYFGLQSASEEAAATWLVPDAPADGSCNANFHVIADDAGLWQAGKALRGSVNCRLAISR